MSTSHYTSHLYTCNLLHFSSLLELRQSYLGGLDSLEEILGMNSNMSSSKVLPSLYYYSHTCELEYSLYVMILTYELEYNFYVMRLAYMTLYLTIHITYIIGIRAKLRWRFIMPLGVPKSFTCRSIGSESREDLGSFCVIRPGA